MRKLSRRSLFSAMAASMAPVAVRAERRQVARDAFEVTHLELFLPGLDAAHDGLKVVQLSDLHIGADVPDSRIAAAVRVANQLRPDLIALTGDFVTSKNDPVERVSTLLEPLAAPRVAVLGNHDHWSRPAEVTAVLEGIGVSVLQNQHTVLRVRGKDFTVMGIDDSTTRNDDVGAAFKGTREGSSLVLTHTPRCAGKLPENRGLLCLSGHTHGGQWDLPGITPGIFMTTGQPWYRGHYDVRGNQLYVNRGLGFGAGTRLPRINSDPEVTCFTLRRREVA